MNIIYLDLYKKKKWSHISLNNDKNYKDLAALVIITENDKGNDEDEDDDNGGDSNSDSDSENDHNTDHDDKKDNIKTFTLIIIKIK